jgi:hypothetical protein
VRSRSAQVGQDVRVVAAGFFEGVGQDGQQQEANSRNFLSPAWPRRNASIGPGWVPASHSSSVMGFSLCVRLGQTVPLPSTAGVGGRLPPFYGVTRRPTQDETDAGPPATVGVISPGVSTRCGGNGT